MRHRVSSTRVLAASALCALVVPAAGWSRPAPPVMQGWPQAPDDARNAENTRQLGTFKSEAEAVEAAKAADLPAGVYGVAMIPGYVVAITAGGTVYLLGYLGGSGMPPRKPQ